MIEPLEPEREPVLCYFNTGFGLYSDGLTCIEIENDMTRLIKWPSSVNDTPETPFREIYGKDRLSGLIGQIIG